MNFWESISRKLISKQPVILMIVVKSVGSSPGKPGFKMAVAGDGEIWGSIGGGNMEYRLAEQCRRMLGENDNKISILKQDHHPDAKQGNSGMICSGIQWIAFYPLIADNSNLIKNIITIGNKRLKDYVTYSDSGIKISKHGIYPKNSDIFVEEDKWLFSEQPGLKNRLYIFGAGHVSLALSKLASDIDFDVVVYDNRKNINTFNDNTYVYSKKIINYSEASKFIEEGSHIYVVIMTFAHQSDKNILKQLIQKQVKYLGMMGSKLKVESIFNSLKDEGVTKTGLTKVDAPVGLPINSITPAEIAVSILAKIIEVKNKNVAFAG